MASNSGYKVTIYEDKAGKYRWRLKARNGRIMADSGQGVRRPSDCQHGARRAQAAMCMATIERAPKRKKSGK